MPFIELEFYNQVKCFAQVEFAEPATWEVIKQTLISNEFPPEDEHSM